MRGPQSEVGIGSRSSGAKASPASPYGVVYYATDSEIVIVAYAHEKRRPGYWKHRVED